MKKITFLSVLSAILFPLTQQSMAQTPGDSIALNEVVVTGSRQETDARHLPMTVTTLSNGTLQEHHRSSILPTLNEQVPGLFTTGRGIIGYGVSRGSAGAFTMRGVGGTDPNAGMLVLIDGIPQYAGLMAHPIADAYQTMMAERVEVLRGPASSLYGSNAMGGVVNIVTRQMKTDGTHTSLRLSAGSYGTLQAEAVNRFRKGNFHSIIGLNYGRTDGHRKNSDFTQYSGFAKIGYDISKHWELSGDVNITYFESTNPGEKQNPYLQNEQDITRGMASINLTNDYGKTSGAIRAYYNWGHHEVNDGYHPGEKPQTQLYMHNDRMAGLSLYESFSLFSGNRLTIGADWTHFGGRAWNEVIATKEEKELADKSENELAAYLDLQQKLCPWLSLNAGLRIDHHTQVGTELVPQGGLAFILPNNIELKAMVSKGFRNPTIREMYMFPPHNPNLKPERIINYEFGYKQTLMDKKLQLGANLFYLTGENLITTIMTDGKKKNVNLNEIKNYGLELTAHYRPTTHWRINANYSLLQMETPVLASPEHKLNIGVNYHADKFSVATNIQYIAGLYTSIGEKEETEQFTLWNLTANYHFNPNLTFFVKGENLLAQQYEINYGFPMPKATFMGGINWEW